MHSPTRLVPERSRCEAPLKKNLPRKLHVCLSGRGFLSYSPDKEEEEDRKEIDEKDEEGISGWLPRKRRG